MRKNRRLRTHTKGFRLGRDRNLDERKDFREKEVFGSKEKRERSKC